MLANWPNPLTWQRGRTPPRQESPTSPTHETKDSGQMDRSKWEEIKALLSIVLGRASRRKALKDAREAVAA